MLTHLLSFSAVPGTNRTGRRQVEIVPPPPYTLYPKFPHNHFPERTERETTNLCNLFTCHFVAKIFVRFSPFAWRNSKTTSVSSLAWVPSTRNRTQDTGTGTGTVTTSLVFGDDKSHDALMTLPVEGFNGTLRILLPHNNNRNGNKKKQKSRQEE